MFLSTNLRSYLVKNLQSSAIQYVIVHVQIIMQQLNYESTQHTVVTEQNIQNKARHSSINKLVR